MDDDGGHNGHGTDGIWRKAWMACMKPLMVLDDDGGAHGI